jgi:hypothetical protein
MLDADPPEDDADPAEDPPDEDEPPDPPPPDGRETAVPLELPPPDGRDSGRSFAWPARAGATLKENAAAAAHKVVARRVMLSSPKTWLAPLMVDQSLGFRQSKKQCSCHPQSSVTR